MVYKWKNFSYIKADAQVAGEMCEKLEADGNLTAQSLLDANRPADAPLHNEFEWDDGIAAEEYRKSQARHIINCLCVIKETDGGKKEPQRVFFNIRREEHEYKHIDTIIRSQDDTAMLLQTALKELEAFERKYSQLKELSRVFDAIHSIGKNI